MVIDHQTYGSGFKHVLGLTLERYDAPLGEGDTAFKSDFRDVTGCGQADRREDPDTSPKPDSSNAEAANSNG